MKIKMCVSHCNVSKTCNQNMFLEKLILNVTVTKKELAKPVNVLCFDKIKLKYLLRGV